MLGRSTTLIAVLIAALSVTACDDDNVDPDDPSEERPAASNDPEVLAGLVCGVSELDLGVDDLGQHEAERRAWMERALAQDLGESDPAYSDLGDAGSAVGSQLGLGDIGEVIEEDDWEEAQELVEDACEEIDPIAPDAAYYAETACAVAQGLADEDGPNDGGPLMEGITDATVFSIADAAAELDADYDNMAAAAEDLYLGDRTTDKELNAFIDDYCG